MRRECSFKKRKIGVAHSKSLKDGWVRPDKPLDLPENANNPAAVVMDDGILPHPQSLNLAERMERAVYLGLDEKNITAKYVAGRKII